jgi:SAM-dependent methyltransferase
MNWKLKAHAMAVLSRIPGGRSIYHRLQRLLGTNRLDADEGVRRSLEVLDLLARAGGTFRDATALEIGTGWRPFLPLTLFLAGTKRIITLDVNPWLTLTYAMETYRAIEPQLPTIIEQLQEEKGRVRERYHSLAPGGKSLSSFLAAAGIDYCYPGDARSTGLPEASIDFVCSSNVMEHVPPDVIRKMHSESFRILRPGGFVIHRFNPGDHFASVDRSITKANFLRFSEKEWRWYGGSGLSYHNRLRCVQHRDLLYAAGFEIVAADVRVDSRTMEAIRNGHLPIHADFAGLSPEQLAADYMWLVGRKP